MGKKERIKKSNTELEQELKIQFVLLQKHCETYDSGIEIIGKHIATVLRVLLHLNKRPVTIFIGTVEDQGYTIFKYCKAY